MKNKTVITILSICILLFLYIVLVDEKLMSTDEKKARSENVFETLRADLVDKIEIETSKGKVVLEATGMAKGEETTWRITSPKSLKADSTEVQALISSMDFLIYQRKVTESRDDKKFGFKTPRVTGSVHFRDKSLTFNIGADAPDQDGVYVAVNSETSHFYVTSTDFLDAMNKSVNDLRDKHLLDLTADEIAGVAVLNDTQKWTATRNATTGDWYVNKDALQVLGATAELKQLVGAVADLKITKFVSDNPTDITGFGLNPPTGSITVMRSGNKNTTIDIGGACGKSGVYASVEGSDAVHCVAAKFESLLARPRERYFEKRFLTMPTEEIARIRIEKDSDKIEMFKEDDLWHVGGLTDEDTSQTAFSELLEALKGYHAEALRFAPPDSPTSDTAPGGASPRLQQVPGENENPHLSVTLETADGATIALSLYNDPVDENSVLVRREHSAGWLPFDVDLAAQLTPHPFRFRTKVMSQCHPEDAISLEILAGSVAQTLKKSDNRWLIISPVAAETDASKIKKLVSLVCETPVNAYPVSQDDPFTPGNLFATVTVSFTRHNHDGETQDDTRTGQATIEIGAAADNNTRFARVKEKPEIVFTVENQYTAFLTRPLAARNLLSIQAGIINDVVFKNADLQFHARKESGRWHSDVCTIDSAAMERVVIDFGAVKAIDSQAFVTDVPHQSAEIQFNSTDETAPATLKFGTINADSDSIVAMRDGLNISFLLPARLVRDMADVCTSN